MGENWVLVKGRLSKIQSSEIRFLRFVKVCTLRGRLFKEDICKELNIFNIQDCVADNEERWIAHLNKMPDCRFLKEVWQSMPIGKTLSEDIVSVGEVDVLLGIGTCDPAYFLMEGNEIFCKYC